MKLILNIYDHGEAMHVKFYRGVVSYSRVIALLIGPFYFWRGISIRCRISLVKFFSLKNYSSDFKYFQTSGLSVTLNQSCSNYFDWLKKMAARVHGLSFPLIILFCNIVRETNLANVVVL